jgi:YkoY family integral membrane protein
MTSQEIFDGLAVIASLVLIEGLLSVDNVLGIAALARGLPPDDQKKAIRLGMAGAYLFRVLALLAATWLISNTWVRWLGAGYLIYLMASHLCEEHAVEEADGTAGSGDPGVPGKAAISKAGLAAVLVQIGLMDLSLSIDNVIAAVGLSEKRPDGSHIMWPIYAGVGFAILALQAIAPHAVKLLKRFPILEPAAFVLIGYVGCILLAEEAWPLLHSGHKLHVESWQKFIGIIIIVFIAFLYSNNRGLQRLLNPVFAVARPVMKGFARLVEIVFLPLSLTVKAITGIFRKPTAA